VWNDALLEDDEFLARHPEFKNWRLQTP
jgi:hypothetical protein